MSVKARIGWNVAAVDWQAYSAEASFESVAIWKMARGHKQQVARAS